MKWITHTHPAYGSTLKKLEGFVIPRKFLTESLGSEMIPWPYFCDSAPAFLLLPIAELVS